jgi:hypothetical protein
MAQLKIWNGLSEWLEKSTWGKLRIWIFLSDLVCAPLGWLFLLVKFRDRKKMTEVKRTDYDGSYAVAGRLVFLQFFLLLMALIVLAVTYALITGNLEGG